MNLRIAIIRASRSVRENGLRTVISRAIATFGSNTPDAFDTLHGIDTSGAVPPWRLRGDAKVAQHAVKYQASGESEIRDAVSFAGIDPDKTLFIDLGCGKGRTLIVAHLMGFKDSIGVEFDPSLAEIAKRNLNQLSIADAAVIVDDAARYVFPAHDFVLYLYNPFSEPPMRAVAANLAKCEAKKITVIYKRPVLATVFDTCGELQRLGSPPNHPDIVVWRRR